MAKILGALRENSVSCTVIDANLEGICHLLGGPVASTDTWSGRACRNIDINLKSLRSWAVYSNPDKYKRAVMDVNRLLHMAGRDYGVDITLSNYSSPSLLPVRSSDLLKAAECFDKNPFFPYFKKRLTESFLQHQPDIVGFSINFFSQALCAFAMAGFIKNLAPNILIVLGGGLITSWMNIPGFKNPFNGIADQLVSGPGEAALLSMCRQETSCRSSGNRYDYGDFNLNQYLSPGPVLPYSGSRGCYWKKCAFCPEQAENSAYVPSEPHDVIEDIHRLKRMISPCLIHFVDNALSPKLLKHLAENPLGTPWYGFARITPHLTDPDFVRGLKDSGCVMLKLGIESGDQAVLDDLQKGIDITTASNALRTIKAASIATYVYLLFGTPQENGSSAAMTLDFTLAHAEFIDFLNLAVFNLPAYSKEAEGLSTVPFYQGDLSLYREFIHPKGWNRNMVRQFIAKQFKRKTLIKSILHNDPPFFTSNHAPFFKGVLTFPHWGKIAGKFDNGEFCG
ncbi:Radical SAM domain protein [uncultured Desulfobacterium sp.]|uniref:Radical SAM domain protein n=1 Tax=uncultured Desulfobacterium sp. TaxID=201089 RepID=A0A445N3Y5_9BACT|nr:Radical SAM domain protein [uncultured Desulfobacterium sp.]